MRTAALHPFLPVEGEGLHQIPVGPVHAGIIEPGHFRFTADGETVVRLEERLGYVHKGIERLLQGADIARGARLAGRVSGDSTVAYALAFARAVEAALGWSRRRARAGCARVMAELERLANHLGDFGAICNDAAFAHHACPLRACCASEVLRAADACFGHRLMMDCVVPGGVAAICRRRRRADRAPLIGGIAAAFAETRASSTTTASLQDRTVGTGIARPELARRFGAGGFVGRASGRDFDARASCPYPPYDRLALRGAGAARRATSTRASGCASTRSSRASR